MPRDKDEGHGSRCPKATQMVRAVGFCFLCLSYMMALGAHTCILFPQGPQGRPPMISMASNLPLGHVIYVDALSITKCPEQDSYSAR